MLFCWINGLTAASTSRLTGISRKTICSWYVKFRYHAIHIYLNQKGKIGGAGCIVEVDESVFGKRKFNVGRCKATQCVVGGITRGRSPPQIFLELVAKRNASTLEDVIRRNVLEGTTIMTDCHRGYLHLDRIGYEHLTVNHSKNFVDPLSGACTNNIEATWKRLKDGLRQGGVTKKCLPYYLYSKLWLLQQQGLPPCEVTKNFINSVVECHNCFGFE